MKDIVHIVFRKMAYPLQGKDYFHLMFVELLEHFFQFNEFDLWLFPYDILVIFIPGITSA